MFLLFKNQMKRAKEKNSKFKKHFERSKKTRFSNCIRGKFDGKNQIYRRFFQENSWDFLKNESVFSNQTPLKIGLRKKQHGCKNCVLRSQRIRLDRKFENFFLLSVFGRLWPNCWTSSKNFWLGWTKQYSTCPEN